MKFVVIEGLDGSGKSTQLKRLKSYLKKAGINYKYLHFPRTESPFFGELIARFLRGEFGEIGKVDPYLVALIYAGDRNDAKKLINKWKDENYLVVVDRYVFSNIAFQCAKLESADDKEKLSTWIKEIEYEYFKIPKPDLNIFLDVPFAFTTMNLKSDRKGNDRDYLNGKDDIHEKDLDFQEKVRQVYLHEVNSDNELKIINCADQDSAMLDPENIFQKIIDLLKQHKII